MNSISTIGCALVLLGSSLVTVDVQAQILKNGGFESPALTDANPSQENPLSTNIGGWIVGGSPGSVYVIRCPAALTHGTFGQSQVNYCSPSEGNQYLKLNGQASGANVFQTVPTTPDVIYRLRYSFAAARDVPNLLPGSVDTIRVSVESAGQTLVTKTVRACHGCFGGLAGAAVAGIPGDHQLLWPTQELTFRATSSQTTITFADILNTDLSKPFIDDVSFIDNVVLEELPSRTAILPSFLGLVAISLIGWYVIRRIRRSRVPG